LNDSQREAVELALNTPEAALIQGPPGTGKTTVIAHLVRRLVDRGARVLVSAFTNTAVDTMLVKMLEVGVDDFVRVGRSTRSPRLSQRIEGRGGDPADYFSSDLASSAKSLDTLADTLLARSVVASTTHRCVSSSLMAFLERERGERPFDVAIVDEAAQITEPMTLAAINLADRFALVGDHRQLPPIVENERAHSHFVTGFEGADAAGETPPELDEMACAGLDRSLFERLARHLPRVVLEEQYRMHADIMAFSNRTFYDGRLRAHASVRERTLSEVDAPTDVGEPLSTILAPAFPLVFVDVDHDGHARHNEREAQAVVDSIEALLEYHSGEPSVGVVSPFRAQVHLIRKLLRQSLPGVADDIDVDTVERFQGSERDAILVSLVKTERAGDFLADERRLNVTLTRAKKKLVVFGSRACLELNPMYRSLIEQPETHLVSWSS
ncbi:MAG: AAA domain-containing protein, partial [Persicimonas sp.]